MQNYAFKALLKDMRDLVVELKLYVRHTVEKICKVAVVIQSEYKTVEKKCCEKITQARSSTINYFSFGKRMENYFL